MSKSKTRNKPKTQPKLASDAPRPKAKLEDDDDRPRRPLVQVIGGAIVAVAVACAMLVSVITPFFY